VGQEKKSRRIDERFNIRNKRLLAQISLVRRPTKENRRPYHHDRSKKERIGN